MSETPNLGKLSAGQLRDVWPHEAHHFTPWLAQNLELLAEVVGIQLELEQIEVFVEGFSADIVARNPLDNSRVLIENQLEKTDHSHLGQILTYLAGLEAKTVIWIAAEFHPAHLSAIQWLNTHTSDSFNFFAIQLRVVRIANSPFAPVFDVKSGPNTWERQLIKNSEKQPSALSQFRSDFWNYYLSSYPDEQAHFKPGADSNRFQQIPGWELLISCYVAKGSVGVYVRTRLRDTTADVNGILGFHAEKLTDLLKGVRRTINKQGKYSFLQWYEADTSNRELWPELVKWLYTTKKHYLEVFQTVKDDFDDTP